MMNRPSTPLSASVDFGSSERGMVATPNPLALSHESIHKRKSHPAMLKIQEFSFKSPNSPNLQRFLDRNDKVKKAQAATAQEEHEKRVRELESDHALAPSRFRCADKLPFSLSADCSVVSLPICLSELYVTDWFQLEQRFLEEFDRVRETSLRLLFGKHEKAKRIGRGAMEEPIITVSPFKTTRVKLSKPPQAPREADASFYNASWIGREFIAAAMPQTEAARGQFWRLVWEYDVPTVVMLNDDGEGKRRHWDIMRYWPNVLREWEEYGDIEVYKEEQVMARSMSCTVRKLRLRRRGDPSFEKRVDHLQYRDWPDGGVPSERFDYVEFILFLLQLTRAIRHDVPVPVLVHCFGGRGRTGTVIASLLELQKLERFGGDEIDVCGTVSEMRTFRSLLIETLEQYKFTYWAVMAIVRTGKLKKPQ